MARASRCSHDSKFTVPGVALALWGERALGRFSWRVRRGRRSRHDPRVDATGTRVVQRDGRRRKRCSGCHHVIDDRHGGTVEGRPACECPADVARTCDAGKSRLRRRTDHVRIDGRDGGDQRVLPAGKLQPGVLVVAAAVRRPRCRRRRRRSRPCSPSAPGDGGRDRRGCQSGGTHSKRTESGSARSRTRAGRARATRRRRTSR